MAFSFALCILCAVSVLTAVHGHFGSRDRFRPPWSRFPRCGSTSPTCGISQLNAQMHFLSSYDELRKRLRLIKLLSHHPIQVGPVIRNNNHGLLNIDVPIDEDLSATVKMDVCGSGNPKPTIREAVTCTVTQSTISKRGNQDGSKVGRSNLGREIMAVRVGRRGAPRVRVVTQQHGYEASNTDSALQLLFEITRRYRSPLLRKLDMLFILRANPDGGEPDTPPSEIPGPGQPSQGKPLFYRFNVDNTAGLPPTEADFFGSVGQGYELNRYHYAGLNNAIRPVEAQAVVAAMHAFRPDVLFDLHDDSTKVLCDIDHSSVIPPGIIPFPLAACSDPIPVPTVLTNRSAAVVGSFFGDDASVLVSPQFSSLQSGPKFVQNMLLTRNIIASVAKAVDPVIEGRFGRFSVAGFPGLGDFSEGTMDRGAMALGAVGSGFEVLIFKPPVLPIVLSISANGTRTDGTTAVGIEPCFLYDAICIHRHMLELTLKATARLIKKDLKDEGGFCDLPASNGQVFEINPNSGFPPGLVTNGPALIPNGFIGLPALISGRCPQHPPDPLAASQ